MALGRKFNIIAQDGKKWVVGSDQFRIQKDIEDRMKTDKDFFLLVWRSIIQAYGGSIW